MPYDSHEGRKPPISIPDTQAMVIHAEYTKPAANVKLFTIIFNLFLQKISLQPAATHKV